MASNMSPNQEMAGHMGCTDVYRDRVSLPNTLVHTRGEGEEPNYTPDLFMHPEEFYRIMDIVEYSRVHPDRAFAFFRLFQCRGCFRVTLDHRDSTQEASTGTVGPLIPPEEPEYAEMDAELEQRMMEQWRRIHAGRIFNQDNLPFRPVPRGGNNLVNVHNVIQQLMDQPHKQKQEPQISRMNIDADILSYQDTDGKGKVGVYITGGPLTPAYNYFEVEILDTGLNAYIAVGLVPKRYPLDRQPGWNADSVALHADNGRLYKANGRGRLFGTPCDVGDKIGCGIKFEQVQDEVAFRHVVPVFFTKNGKEIGTVLIPMPQTGFFPAVGMHSDGEEVRITLDKTWECKDDILMSIDNIEDEWSRLHDVRLNGQLLEYTGRGKSIADVGLAQGRYPLDTTHHYFEIEIVDPGENCYIAIGLARKDYPSRRHPGWNKGSIAYHADDGKIFVGSGIGEPFGPKCNKGDIMGCGIFFPRDYNAENDSDGTKESDASEGEDVDDYIEVEDYHDSDDSDEERWWERPQPAEGGTKIQVFFTKNGKCIGREDTHIPKGGFYPTVGMLSSDEKVRVDLRPLTG